MSQNDAAGRARFEQMWEGLKDLLTGALEEMVKPFRDYMRELVDSQSVAILVVFMVGMKHFVDALAESQEIKE